MTPARSSSRSSSPLPGWAMLVLPEHALQGVGDPAVRLLGRVLVDNPFSLSAAPDGHMLRLTAKAVGADSKALRDLPVGARVFAEGPYGAFTTMNRTKPDVLLIAGGIGVTPIRSLLEEVDGHVVVLYRARTEADAVLLPEIQELAAARGGQVHLLTGRTAGGPPPFGPDNLVALVPDIAERDVYVCGPPVMATAVLRSLREVGVPSRQVHAERFALVT